MLSNQKCVACKRDSRRLTMSEIQDLLQQVPKWNMNDNSGTMRLENGYKFSDFAKALNFATQLGLVAEEEGHHPRMIVEWGRVSVAWWTHTIDGLHKNDFIMASKTDQLIARLE